MKKFTDKEINEIAQLAREHRSYVKAAKIFGCSINFAAKCGHSKGVHLPSNKDLCKDKKKLVIDGHNFYWQNKGYYSTCIDNVRITLSSYMYKKLYGVPKPREIVMQYKDGNNDNVSVDNIYFVSFKDFAKKLEVKNHENNVKILKKFRKEISEREEKRPWLKTKRMKKAWATRHEKDPDNLSSQKSHATRKAIAEARGYYFTPEQREKMRKSQKGKHGKIKMSPSIMLIKEQQLAIMRKMGIGGQ